eukprot:8657714-Alexandrium_andersonii.AAC.1
MGIEVKERGKGHNSATGPIRKKALASPTSHTDTKGSLAGSLGSTKLGYTVHAWFRATQKNKAR